MDERIEIPRSWWERLRMGERRMVAATAAVVCAIALVAALLALAVTSRAPADPPAPSLALDGAAEPGESEGAAGAGVLGEPDGADRVDVTATPPGSSDDGGSGAGPGVSAPGDLSRKPVARAAYVAFRFGDAIHIAREDGSVRWVVREGGAEAYALSPDAATLALVRDGDLVLVDVASASERTVGPAEPRALAWHPDSSALIFVRTVDEATGATEVFRVRLADGAIETLMRADGPAVASDGTVVAVPSAATEFTRGPADGSVWVLAPDGKARAVQTAGTAMAAAIASGRIFYVVAWVACEVVLSDQVSELALRSVGLDGQGDREVVPPPDGSRPFGYGELMPSPDGRALLFAEVGDDGYSRAWVVGLAPAAAPVALTIRRDTYPVGWSADGSRVFFIEGNAFQGEPTALMSARPDGSDRRVLVKGATR